RSPHMVPVSAAFRRVFRHVVQRDGEALTWSPSPLHSVAFSATPCSAMEWERAGTAVSGF
ncbi:MAG: hypothetical protein ACLFVZ_02475, partial [Actinomycetota bacterium]